MGRINIFFKNFHIKKQLKLTPYYIIMAAFVAFLAYMLGWILVASMSTTRNIFSGDLLADGLSLDNFRTVLLNSNGLTTILNTLIYTIPSTLLLIVICAPAAYCLARYDFKLNKTFQQLIVIALTVPGIMITMPVFYHISSLGITDSRLVLILLFTANSIPFDIYFLMGYYKNISTTYEESAALDGSGPLRTFWEIMFPMAKPAIVTLTIFNLIGKWNAYFLPLIFANTPEMRPIGVWLQTTINSMVVTGNYGGMFAAVVIASLPTIIVYAFLSKKITAGANEGGIKG
jgi:N-acetylglucosamine transport system permease protein